MQENHSQTFKLTTQKTIPTPTGNDAARSSMNQSMKSETISKEKNKKATSLAEQESTLQVPILPSKLKLW